MARQPAYQEEMFKYNEKAKYIKRFQNPLILLQYAN